MAHLIGEYECKLDAKGRMMIPVGLKKQLPEAEGEAFVINRGFENNLVIYTKAEWDIKLEELSKLNQYDRKNVLFIRYFTGGATAVNADSAGRLNVPNHLLEHAGIEDEAVLVCMLSKVEMWAPAALKEITANAPDNYAELAEEVLGSKRKAMNE